MELNCSKFKPLSWLTGGCTRSHSFFLSCSLRQARQAGRHAYSIYIHAWRICIHGGWNPDDSLYLGLHLAWAVFRTPLTIGICTSKPFCRITMHEILTQWGKNIHKTEAGPWQTARQTDGRAQVNASTRKRLHTRYCSCCWEMDWSWFLNRQIDHRQMDRWFAFS